MIVLVTGSREYPYDDRGDDDLDLEEVHELVQPGDRPDLY